AAGEPSSWVDDHPPRLWSSKSRQKRAVVVGQGLGFGGGGGASVTSATAGGAGVSLSDPASPSVETHDALATTRSRALATSLMRGDVACAGPSRRARKTRQSRAMWI